MSPYISAVFATQIIAFMVMRFFGVSRSLIGRPCSRDGDGINFNLSLNTSYGLHELYTSIVPEPVTEPIPPPVPVAVLAPELIDLPM